MKKNLSVLLIIAPLLVVSCTILPSSGTITHERAWRIGFLPMVSNASFFVAFEERYFTSGQSNEGGVFELVKFETSEQALEALVADRIDVLAPVDLQAALTLEANNPGQFKIVELAVASEQTRVHRIEVKPNSSIKGLPDLRGKTLGIVEGTPMRLLSDLIFARYLDVKTELQTVQVSMSLQGQALEHGNVDAIFCLEPSCTMLELQHVGRPISVNPLWEFIQRPFPTDCSLISTRLAKNNPKVLNTITSALQRSYQFQRTNPDVTAVHISKYVSIDIDVALQMGKYDYWDVASADRNSVQRLADLYSEKGVLPKRISTFSLYATQSIK